MGMVWPRLPSKSNHGPGRTYGTLESNLIRSAAASAAVRRAFAPNADANERTKQ